MSLCALNLFEGESVVEGRFVPAARDLVTIVSLLVAL